MIKTEGAFHHAECNKCGFKTEPSLSYSAAALEDNRHKQACSA